MITISTDSTPLLGEKLIRSVRAATADLYANHTAAQMDVVWYEPQYADDSLIQQFKTIASEDMEGIRKLFKDGYTCSLLGDAMGEMEKWVDNGDELEVRVLNKEGKLIGVVIHDEINY